jgi:hypothetical protein
MTTRGAKITVFLLILVTLSACAGPLPATVTEAEAEATELDQTEEPTDAPIASAEGSQVIGTVSNIKTQVHAGPSQDLQLVEGEAGLGNDDFVSVTEGGKARLEFPGPIHLLLFNQSDMDGINLEYDENSNPRIVNRLIRGGFSGYVAPGNQLTVDLAFGVKVNVLGTNFFIIYDEERDFLIIGKFDGTLTVSIPGQPILELEDSELVDIRADGAIRHYSPFSFTPSEFETMADRCSSPILGANILRRDHGLPLPGEETADQSQDLPCGPQSEIPVVTTEATVTPLTWVDLDYCSRSDRDICVNSMGLLNQDMLITVQIERSNISSPFILIEDDRYPCTEIATSQYRYFCIGNPVSPNETVTIQIFHQDDQLLAQGDFLIFSLVGPPTARPKPDDDDEPAPYP